MNTNSTSYKPYNPNDSSSNVQGAYQPSAGPLTTTVSQVSNQALKPQSYDPLSSSSPFQGNALSVATHQVRTSASQAIAVPSSYQMTSNLVIKQFSNDLEQDRRTFAKLQDNLQKTALNIFKILEEVDVTIREHEQKARRLLQRVEEAYNKVSKSFTVENGIGGEAFNGVTGLLNLAEKQIDISLKNCQQLQASRESSCLKKLNVVGELVVENFKLRSKELELLNSRLESLRTHQDAELDRLVKIHSLKLEAEAQLFEQLTQLAELELKSNQQNFDQRKELIELEQKVIETQENIRLQELQLANDKELALIYSEVQRELQLEQINADTRCNLAKIAAKEAVKMAQAEMQKEAALAQTEMQKVTGLARTKMEGKTKLAEVEAQKESTIAQAQAQQQAKMAETEARKAASMHATTMKARTDMHHSDNQLKARQHDNVTGLISKVIKPPVPCLIM